jgi:hypothetical protein
MVTTIIRLGILAEFEPGKLKLIGDATERYSRIWKEIRIEQSLALHFEFISGPTGGAPSQPNHLI